MKCSSYDLDSYLMLDAIVATDEAMLEHINAEDPGLTVCPVCRVNDYVHFFDCPIAVALGDRIVID